MKRIKDSQDEFDAFSFWRHKLCGLDRPGVRKKWKLTYNKRFRKAAKAETYPEG